MLTRNRPRVWLFPAWPTRPTTASHHKQACESVQTQRSRYREVMHRSMRDAASGLVRANAAHSDAGTECRQLRGIPPRQELNNLSGRHAQFLALPGGLALRHPLGLNDRKRQHHNRDPLMHQREYDWNLVQEGQDAKRRL